MRFDILDRTLNPLGKHFLEASAGTGKTFTIEHLVVRLLLEEEKPFSLDRILVVTFTRAATRELKGRILATLQSALNVLQGKQKGPDYLSALCEKGENVVKSARRKIEEALACFDQAQIFTLHGFCHRMLAEYAFEAKVGLELNDPDESEHRGQMLQAIQDFFYVGLKPSAYSSRQLEAVLKRHQQDIGKLSQRLMQMIERGGQIESFPDFTTLHHQFLKTLKEVKEVEAEKFLEDFNRLAPCYKKMTGKGFLQQAQLLAKMLEKKNCTLEEWDELLKEGEFFLEKFHPENLKVRAKMPAALHYPELFDRLAPSLCAPVQSAQDPLKIFSRMARDCSEYWNAYFQNRDLFTPDQILKKMESCLDYPPFFQAVSRKYRAVIIDEFQDTDPIQWNIFNRLFLSEDKEIEAFYLVGDPKQSIYAFRRADLYTYLKASETLGKESKAFLDTNFRSEPALVHALNLLFSLPGWISLPSLETTLEYQKVKAREGAGSSINDHLGSLHFFIAQAERGREKNWPPSKLEEELFFPFIAQEIQNLSRFFPLSHIAVLVKDRYQGRRLKNFLKTHSIPSHLKRGESLQDSPALLALEQLLRAIQCPEDLNLLKQALGGILIQWDLSRLKQTLEDEPVQQAKAFFLFLRDLAQEKGFGPCFQEFLFSKWNEKTVIEELVQREDLSLYQELRALIELFIAHEAKTLKSLEGLLSFSQELRAKHAEEEELRNPGEDSTASVPILTIHMSKGLEFEIVFALGVASRHPQQEEWMCIKEKIVAWDRTKQECLEALKELEAEKMRQLYVALTRAKKRVYVPIAFEKDQKPLSLGEASPIELFFSKQELLNNLKDFLSHLQKWQTEGITYSYLNEIPLSVSAFEGEVVFLSPPLPCDIPSFSKRIYSFSSLSQKKPSFKGSFRLSEEKNAHTLPLGTETGTCLHRILEKIFSKGWHSPVDVQKIGALIQKEIQGTPLETWKEVLAQMVVSTLHLPLLDFSLKDIPSSQVLQEMEFVFSAQNSLITGFADLVFEKDKKYYLLDWKSNWLGPDENSYTPSSLESAMRDNDYFLQASLYTEALRRYVKLFDSRPFSACFGGAFYLFLRGGAVVHFFPKEEFDR